MMKFLKVRRESPVLLKTGLLCIFASILLMLVSNSLSPDTAKVELLRAEHIASKIRTEDIKSEIKRTRQQLADLHADMTVKHPDSTLLTVIIKASERKELLYYGSQDLYLSHDILELDMREELPQSRDAGYAVVRLPSRTGRKVEGFEPDGSLRVSPEITIATAGRDVVVDVENHALNNEPPTFGLSALIAIHKRNGIDLRLISEEDYGNLIRICLKVEPHLVVSSSNPSHNLLANNRTVIDSEEQVLSHAGLQDILRKVLEMESKISVLGEQLAQSKIEMEKAQIELAEEQDKSWSKATRVVAILVAAIGLACTIISTLISVLNYRRESNETVVNPLPPEFSATISTQEI